MNTVYYKLCYIEYEVYNRLCLTRHESKTDQIRYRPSTAHVRDRPGTTQAHDKSDGHTY